MGSPPALVNDHDFRSDASAVGISYGITTRRTTAGLSASASLTIRQPSPLIPSPPGGKEKDRVAGVVFPSY
jgi:hypothetical protein